MAEQSTHEISIDEPTIDGDFSWACSCGAGSEDGMAIPTREAAVEEAQRHLDDETAA